MKTDDKPLVWRPTGERLVSMDPLLGHDGNPIGPHDGAVRWMLDMGDQGSLYVYFWEPTEDDHGGVQVAWEHGITCSELDHFGDPDPQAALDVLATRLQEQHTALGQVLGVRSAEEERENVVLQLGHVLRGWSDKLRALNIAEVAGEMEATAIVNELRYVGNTAAELRMQGARRERAAVVAYMRDVAGTATGFGAEGCEVLDATADAIERGDHGGEVSDGG